MSDNINKTPLDDRKHSFSFFQPNRQNFPSVENSSFKLSNYLPQNLPKHLSPILSKYVNFGPNSSDTQSELKNENKEFSKNILISDNHPTSSLNNEDDENSKQEYIDISENYETAHFEENFLYSPESEDQSTFGYSREDSRGTNFEGSFSNYLPSFSTKKESNHFQAEYTPQNNNSNYLSHAIIEEMEEVEELCDRFESSEANFSNSNFIAHKNGILKTPNNYGTPNGIISFDDFFKSCKSNSNTLDDSASLPINLKSNFSDFSFDNQKKLLPIKEKTNNDHLKNYVINKKVRDEMTSQALEDYSIKCAQPSLPLKLALSYKDQSQENYQGNDSMKYVSFDNQNSFSDLSITHSIIDEESFESSPHSNNLCQKEINNLESPNSRPISHTESGLEKQEQNFINTTKRKIDEIEEKMIQNYSKSLTLE